MDWSFLKRLLKFIVTLKIMVLEEIAVFNENFLFELSK